MNGRVAPLSPDLLRAVRTASVPPHVRATFEHLPQPVRVDAELPEAAEKIPPSVLQLLKLAHVGDRVRLGDVVVGSALRVVVSLGEKRCVLAPEDLAIDVRDLARRILGSLFEGSDVARLLESFAFRSSSLATLQRITNHMLQATDVDGALSVMLSGITSGQGLSFHRAALFTHDASRGAFVGSKATGPADGAAAHRIWEEIEVEDKTVEQLIDDCLHGRLDTRFQERVLGVELVAGSSDEDELTRALASDTPIYCREPPRNPSLVQFGVAPEFVLAALKPHGKVLGLLLADNLYGDGRLTPEQLTSFAFFIDQTALIWENLLLLRRVEALARYDGLTGVFNRRELDARLEVERSRCQRSGASCSVLLIDVDRFKETNDELGHAAGDAILRRLGALLRDTVREHDVAARFGGDEFAILLPDATHADLVATVRRIGALARSEGISLSVGGATWPGDVADTRTLLAIADGELYCAKRAGRGCAFVAGERIDFAV